MMDANLLSALRKNIHILGNSLDDGTFDDLSFLKDTLMHVRIIGLGEASHGTSEHFQFKHRIIRFLVEQMGFRTFVIESALDACDVVNDYVVYGKGDRAKALAGLHFWTWDTEEVSAMIDWMREHNSTCPAGEEVKFLGFDMQSCDVACARLLQKLVPVAGEDADKISAYISSASNIDRFSEKENYPDPTWLLGWVCGHEVPLTRATDPIQYRQFVRYARHLYQFLTHYQVGPTNTTRDMFMAENIHFLLNELPAESKIILWAHNGHMATHFEWKTIGHWLREDYGSSYYALGFALHEGQFRTRLFDRIENTVGALDNYDVPPISEHLWEYDLYQVAAGNYFIDIRDAMDKSGEIDTWAKLEKPFLMLDEAWDPNHGLHHYEISGVLCKTFDGMLYTEKTHHTRPTPTGHRSAKIKR